MKILWVSMNGALYDNKDRDNYGGIGWIGALYDLLRSKNIDFQLAIVFLGSSSFKDETKGITFYSINRKAPTGFNKWLYYINGYKQLSINDFYTELENVIDDFHPDLIHLWGVENRLSSVCHYKKIPVIAHIQGLLSQCIDKYYPYMMNAYTFRLKRFSKREWILHNGFIFGEKEMAVRAKIEQQHLRAVPAVMGRTDWDRHIALFNNPQIKYFHVDEALRAPFYQTKPWNKKREGKFILYSTISETVYKGLDLIMRTAALLKEYNYFDFEWQIAGVESHSDFVRWFEKIVQINISDVSIRLLGKQSPQQLIDGLKCADLYIHPSYIDNSPNSLCEAQYLGVPCCATNVGGIPSLIENAVTGILFPLNSPTDLAFTIKDCYDEEEKWRTFAYKGRVIAQKRHSPDSILKQLLFAYNKMIE